MADSLFNDTSLSDLLNEASVTPDSRPGSEEQLTTPESGGYAAGEGKIPYERFKEVNEERKLAQSENTQLRAMLDRALAQGQQQVQTAANPPTATAPQTLFSQEEVKSYADQLLMGSPEEVLARYGQAIFDRGVRPEVDRAKQELRQEMLGLAGQVQGVLGTTVLDGYVLKNFQAPQVVAAKPVFDALVKEAAQANPSILTNPQMLDNLRDLAIGRAYAQGALQPQPNPGGSLPFMEQPRGMPGVTLIGQGNAGRSPDQLVADQIGQRLGLKPGEAGRLFDAMEKNGGIFR